ncbi:MAG: hypothetical protein EOM25_08250 [Deltaproteobacteria bacterium]|nr:hypothetical protein [Deltaproteobacteria bacterium]
MKKPLNGMLIFGVITTFVFGSTLATSLVGAFWGPKDIWWTPASMALPLSQTANDFQMFIAGTPVDELVTSDRLQTIDAQEHEFKVALEDIRIRKNNWLATKARELTMAVFQAFGFGLGLGFLCTGLLSRLSAFKSGEKQRRESP